MVIKSSKTAANLTNSYGDVRMVNISEKPVTRRSALASSKVKLGKDAYQQLKSGTLPKGDVFASARIAGIQAVKRTSELIPLCHQLLIENVIIAFETNDGTHSVGITAQVTCTGKTGVEMEALTAVSIAALTIYDMCKSIDKAIEITDIKLLKKSK